MNRWVRNIKTVFLADSGGLSSKRICGVLGWIVCLGIAIYCTIAVIQAPLILETILWCCMGLLGIDSVTSIWKKLNKDDKSAKNKRNNEEDSGS